MASPVPLFNGLKHLQCPKEAGGDVCTTTGCLFGHKSGHAPSNSRRFQSYDGPADQNDSANVNSQGPPNKRQKTDPRCPTSPQPRGRGEDGVQDEAIQERVAPHFINANANNNNDDDDTSPVHQAQASDLYDPLSPPNANKSTSVEPPKQVTAFSPPLQKQDSAAPPPTTTPVKHSALHTPTHRSNSLLVTQNSKSALKLSGAAVAGRSTPTSSLDSSLVHHSLPAGRSASPSAKPRPTSQAEVRSPSHKPKPQRKPESLNPRHLQSAPAAHAVRHKLLGLLHADYSRLNGEVTKRSLKDPGLKPLILSAQELIWMALDREQHLATDRPAIYNNAMRQEVVRYKRMQFDTWASERKQAVEKKVPVQQKNTGLGMPVAINTGLAADQEIKILRKIVTPITNLEPFGYVTAPPTEEQINETKQAVEWARGWEQCDRCTARFRVFPGRNIETGELASGGHCTHHPGKQYLPQRPPGDKTWIAKKYRCCNETVGDSPGCTTAKNHVWKTNDPKRLASLWNFARTPHNDSPSVRKAAAFDCEMGYTVNGMELVRVTATNWPDGSVLLDVLVQPYGEILDLNSRYSGVFPEDLARAVPWGPDWKPSSQEPGERKILPKVSSPGAARDLLFSLINPDTILLGHGLENDLNAMRMIHPQIVDTILLYPHRLGLPIRTGLKSLMEVILNTRIQIDTGDGHDSAEDARAAGDLARYKVEKEWLLLKSQGWRFDGGKLLAPGSSRPALQEKVSDESIDTEEGGVQLTEHVSAEP